MTENPQALRPWMIAGPEISRMVKEFEDVSGISEERVEKGRHHEQVKCMQTLNCIEKDNTFFVYNINKEDICDMIKRNESDVGDVVFEILSKTVFKFLCFILF